MRMKHDHKLSEIEKGKLICLTSALSTLGSDINNSPFSTIKDNRLLKTLTK